MKAPLTHKCTGTTSAGATPKKGEVQCGTNANKPRFASGESPNSHGRRQTWKKMSKDIILEQSLTVDVKVKSDVIARNDHGGLG
jgi:hypothetical protein